MSKTTGTDRLTRSSWGFLKTFNARAATGNNRSWDFLRTFSTRQVAFAKNWQAVELIQAQARKIIAPNKRRLDRLFKRWEQKLKQFGGDPSNLSDTEFRPLRVSREEDWSDWLKELLERSTSGVLAQTMFEPHLKCDAQDFKRPRVVEREIRTENQDRRGDILVRCQSPLTLTLEVKVWDENFDKTFETARKLLAQEKDPARRRHWHDFILIPEESQAPWEILAKQHADDVPVDVVLWNDVARGLRLSLWKEREPMFWRAWAWTFCGRIENEILNLQKPRPNKSEFGQLEMTLRWLKLLERTRKENTYEG